MSDVPWAIPSIRQGLHSTGDTRRSRVRPKFFIARTVPAMFTRSWVSHRTTTMRSSPSTAGAAELPVTRLIRGVVAGGEAAEEHPRGADVVADIDEQHRQVAGAPQDRGEHDPADHLREEWEECSRALEGDSSHDLGGE